MIGNKESCKQAAFRAAEEAKENLLNKVPKLVVIFESMAKRISSDEIVRIAMPRVIMEVDRIIPAVEHPINFVCSKTD